MRGKELAIIFLFAAAGRLVVSGVVHLQRRSNAEEASVHVGHEAMHAQFAAELSTAKRGDLIISGRMIRVVTTNDQHGEIFHCIPASCDVGAVGHLTIEDLAREHSRVIHPEDPEYDKTLGDYFRRSIK